MKYEFKKYQHLEKFGSIEVEGLIDLEDPCYVFPKIDGTNGSVWFDGRLRFGSRNRELSLENDNQGFMASLHNDNRLLEFFKENPALRLYGEWLVPHTIKDYEDNAWRKFYVFDVVDLSKEEKYVPYDAYKQVLDTYDIEYLPLLAIVKRGNLEAFEKIANNNTYLMKENIIGEGIVIKRYGFKNKFGNTVWAKLVRSEFKSLHVKEMGPQIIESKTLVEDRIVEDFVTSALVEKEFAKIVNDTGWSSKYIPTLLNTVFYTLIKEESWNFVKANKNPTIDFKVLLRLTFSKVKSVKPELF